MSPYEYDDQGDEFVPHDDYGAFMTHDGRDHTAQGPEPEPSNLPEPLPRLASGALTLRDLDEATKGLRAMLEQQLAEHVQARRDERRGMIGDMEPAVADVAQLVRELADAGDVLGRIAADFAAVAKAADQYIADEALATGKDRIAVPDGDREIVVGPDTGKVTEFTPHTLGEVLAYGQAQDWGHDSTPQTPTGPHAVPEDLDPEGSLRWAFGHGFRAGFAAVEDYGKVAWRKTDWNALRRRLMQAREDSLAGMVERSVTETTRKKSDKLKVTREPFKQGRRA